MPGGAESATGRSRGPLPRGTAGRGVKLPDRVSVGLATDIRGPSGEPTRSSCPMHTELRQMAKLHSRGGRRVTWHTVPPAVALGAASRSGDGTGGALRKFSWPQS